MANVNDLFPSKYLKGSELRGPTPVTISKITREEVYRPGEGKSLVMVLYVVNGSRGVILSKPLAFAIAEALGEPDTDNWPGRKVVLFPQPMHVAGRDVTAIRARAAAAPQPVQAGQNGAGKEDDF